MLIVIMFNNSSHITLKERLIIWFVYKGKMLLTYFIVMLVIIEDFQVPNVIKVNNSRFQIFKNVVFDNV